MPDPDPDAWAKELRERAGLSQAAFARRLGVRQQTVSEWETGRYAPRGASLTVLRLLEEEVAPYDASPPEEEEASGEGEAP